MKNNSELRCLNFRKRILELSQKVSALHIGSAYSCIEIMDFIFFKLMKNGSNYKSFIMSKGHASILHYVILEKLGIMKKNDLNNYCTKNSSLGVHPDIGNPGINASTGSLGHGLSIAAGIAIADEKKKKKVYVLLSDGELQEGSTWEAITLIGALKLKNIILIVDNNNLNSSEKMSNTHPNLYPIEKKFSSFGWYSFKCNGHSTDEMFKKYKKSPKNKPIAIIAKTIKGYPISFMKNKALWHYRSPNKTEYKIALMDLNKNAQ
jgi:transketolase